MVAEALFLHGPRRDSRGMVAAALLADVSALMPVMQERAALLDESGHFPAEDIQALQEAGVLAAVLPVSEGGLGLGTEPDGAAGALTLLRLLGCANIALGRLIEAHVNALLLIARYGHREILRAAARDVRAGHIFALWVTDSSADRLRLEAGWLEGCKEFCSGAGHVRRAVVTARDEEGRTRLAVARLEQDVTTTALAGAMQGVRAAATGQVRFSGAAATPFGRPGDYLREPLFSTGAWRASAVASGGLMALVAEARRQLVQRGRAGDPHQQARMGQTFIAEETARLWLEAAAARAETMEGTAADNVAYVNFARLAVERACLDAMALVQRCIGVAAFQIGNPIERICRDLNTYLRQPAPDAVLTEAAAHVMGA
jgi:alkylation response protein AidB-like acyl-CoA dehydrogenase